jgi:hypothetical protein
MFKQNQDRAEYCKGIFANMEAGMKIRARMKEGRYCPALKIGCVCSPNMRDLRYSDILKWYECRTCKGYLENKGGKPNESPWN